MDGFPFVLGINARGVNGLINDTVVSRKIVLGSVGLVLNACSEDVVVVEIVIVLKTGNNGQVFGVSVGVDGEGAVILEAADVIANGNGLVRAKPNEPDSRQV